VQHRAPVGAWLTNDGANHRLALIAVPGLKDDPSKASHTGIHHTAFEYGSMPELLDSFDRLRGLGIEPQACLDHGLTTSLYYADPDRNLVELQADNFGDWAKSSHWMRTSQEFAANPIGVAFDPAKVFDAYRAGRPVADIHTAIMASKFLPAKIPDLSLPFPP